jgi:hypothetical protein
MAILVELPDSAASLLMKAQAEEIANLRAELAKRRRGPPASLWTPQGRRAQASRMRASWAKRKAAKAAATASAHERDGLNLFLRNGDGLDHYQNGQAS